MTIDLATDPEARAFSKQSSPVEVEIASCAGTLATLEGEVAYNGGDALVTGVAGERWPVGRARFDATYTPVPPTGPGQSGQYRRLPNRVLAKQMGDAFDVPLGERGSLHGEPGDWLVQYAPGDQAVVAAQIFRQTYRPADD